MVQIDGLSRAELKRAMATGKTPFLNRLADREHYQLHSLYSGLPSSTPSVQGELFYGHRCAVPAFGFRDHRTKQIVRMFVRDVAADVQQRLAENSPGLLADGSSYCNVYDGGAQESHFCASSLGWDTVAQKTKVWRRVLFSVFHVWSAVRVLALLLIEFGLAIVDFLRGASWRELWQEIMMIPARVVVVILMRELAINGAITDTARGLPIIHVNLLGYDEQAHRRRPDSHFAHWTLKGIDAAIRRLWMAAHRSHARHYDVWVYSDHGQEKTIPYDFSAGMSIQTAVEKVTTEVLGPPEKKVERPARTASPPSYPDRARWLSAGWAAAKLFGEGLTNTDRCDSNPQVAALGPLAHVYLNRNATAEQLTEIASRLVRGFHVPLAFVAVDENRVLALTSETTYQLPRQADELFAAHRFSAEIGQDLMRLCRHPDAGEIVLSGSGGAMPSISFVIQNGAHAGIGDNETHAFALLPGDTPVCVRAGNYLRPSDLHEAAKDLMRDSHNTGTLSTDTPAGAVRVMTYNVHNCRGMDGKLSPRRIGRIIASGGADIVAVQELDAHRSRTNKEHQAHEIARYLEMEYEFHPAWTLAEEKYGDAIFSRFPLRLVKAGALPRAQSGREPRGAIWVEIDLPGGKQLQVINTHLSVFPKEQFLQAQALLSDGWMDEAWKRGRAILIGDFNARPNSPTYQLLARRLDDVQWSHNRQTTAGQPTWPSIRPFVRIDHIFTSLGDFDTRTVRVIATAQANLASDHLPLVAEVALKSPGVNDITGCHLSAHLASRGNNIG